MSKSEVEEWIKENAIPIVLILGIVIVALLGIVVISGKAPKVEKPKPEVKPEVKA
jgi:beta-lactam-binding protein with PASTA domain